MCVELSVRKNITIFFNPTINILNKYKNLLH